ncbi:MAG: DUF3857 and transglutaminase domain-containing protein [Candidatus Bipolaricaulis sp.]|nr:DUF3857 and transglutaminase domain-containing protein [Candidatus Bipolaricaulis sp.]
MSRVSVGLGLLVLLGAGWSIDLASQEAVSGPWLDSGSEVMAGLPNTSQYDWADAVELLREVSWELLPDGSVASHARQRWLILTAAGLSDLRTFDIPYSGDSVTIESAAGRTIRADGAELHATAIADFQPPMGDVPVSSDSRIRRIGLPSVSVGAVIECDVRTRLSAERAPNGLSGQLALRGKYPILRQAYTFSAPVDRMPRWAVLGGDPVAVERSDDGRSVRLSLGEVGAGWTEEQMPCTEEVWPSIRYSFLRSWAELADRLRVFLADDTPSAPTVLAATDSLVAGLRRRGEVIDRLYAFVRDEFAYYALLLGDGGLDAASSAETLQKRRGDCKGLVVLLVTMLRRAGVEAYPALASSTCTLNGAFGGFPWLPTAANHAVVAVQAEDGSWRILDPTCTFCAPDYSSQAGSTVWVLDGEVGSPGTAISLPETQPAENRARSTIDALMSEDGNVEVDAVVTATGGLGAVYTLFLQQLDPASVTTFVSRMLCAGLPAESAPSVTVRDVEVVSTWDPVEVRIRYSIAAGTEPSGAVSLVLPCPPDVLWGPYSAVFPKQTMVASRHYPFGVGTTQWWEYKLTLRLPEGWLPNPWESRPAGTSASAWQSYLPPGVDQTRGAATYRSTYAFSEGVLAVHRELIVAHAWFAPEEYRALDDLVYTARQDMQVGFRFGAPGKP